MQRVFDVVCAGVGLIFLSPIFVLCALAIRLEDGGPVFYSQCRVGRAFQDFRLLKFRSMNPGADRSGLLTSPNDARITRVGRVLRRFKLDELPQLLNVLKGDMQFVGSRPEIRKYVEAFPNEYSQLLRERPGITDPASMAFRNEENEFDDSDIEEQYLDHILPQKLKLSLDYWRSRTFVSDVNILIGTVLGSTNSKRGLIEVQRKGKAPTHK